MAYSLINLQIEYGDPYIYSVGFRNLIENHLNVLRDHNTTTMLPLSSHIEQVWQGDLYGLLNVYGIPQDLFWITMRLNNLHSTTDYNGELGIIYIPSIDHIEKILSTYLNSTTLR